MISPSRTRSSAWNWCGLASSAGSRGREENHQRGCPDVRVRTASRRHGSETGDVVWVRRGASLSCVTGGGLLTHGELGVDIVAILDNVRDADVGATACNACGVSKKLGG